MRPPTLLALNRLWGLDWPLERLLPIGLALGADVPFFLGGTPARARGIGEALRRRRDSRRAGSPSSSRPPSLRHPTVFASPRVAERLDAARIAGFPEAECRPQCGLARPEESGPELADGFGRNDLQAAAEELCPDVARAAAELRAAFGNSRMTGSGSAVFARAGRAGGGPAPSAAMPSDWPSGWSSRMCRSLERHPLAGWARRESRGPRHEPRSG